jgi:hypothetical protein
LNNLLALNIRAHHFDVLFAFAMDEYGNKISGTAVIVGATQILTGNAFWIKCAIKWKACPLFRFITYSSFAIK